jgi:hypothetical protein
MKKMKIEKVRGLLGIHHDSLDGKRLSLLYNTHCRDKSKRRKDNFVSHLFSVVLTEHSFGLIINRHIKFWECFENR